MDPPSAVVVISTWIVFYQTFPSHGDLEFNVLVFSILGQPWIADLSFMEFGAKRRSLSQKGDPFVGTFEQFNVTGETLLLRWVMSTSLLRFLYLVVLTAPGCDNSRSSRSTCRRV